ncbi:hypothetical protein AB0C52_35775 [Streptomyces sp. NPDC048717]|uniref:hypothetical protein n=1 Tax=Streptomyces sp. NPDC048717 TaxID=3154928 RepID=UPI003412726A
MTPDQPPVTARHTPDTAPDLRDTAPGTHADTGGDLLVREMVAQQMRITTTAIYRYITYISLWVLLLCSGTFASVQVWALRGYLPPELPDAAAWALPVALQVLVLAAELILLSSAVTRSHAVQGTAGAVMAIGYGAEITAHVRVGGHDLVTVTLVVMSTLLALCWTLLALALRAGITDADQLVLRQRGIEEPAPVVPAADPAPAPEDEAAVDVELAPAPDPEPDPEPEPEFVPASAADPAPAPEDEPEAEPYVQEAVPTHWYTPTTADTAPTSYDTAADTADTDTDTGGITPAPGAQLSDVEMDAVVHMIVTETDPPRSLREMEARYRELGYVGGAVRIRESWRRVTQPDTADTASDLV